MLENFVRRLIYENTAGPDLFRAWVWSCWRNPRCLHLRAVVLPQRLVAARVATIPALVVGLHGVLRALRARWSRIQYGECY